MFTHALPKLLLDAGEIGVSVRRGVRQACTVVREAACAMSGHDYVLRATGNRMFLRCADCGHETPGWHIDVARGLRRVRSDRATMRRSETPKF
jgi:hypothetical protein